MTSYINIHTHHVPSGHGVFVFNNRYAFDTSYYTVSQFSIGIHPWDAGLVTPASLTALEEYLKHSNCFAIGECGLDKLWGPGLPLQREIFSRQIELAEKYGKPVIIHCVKAFDELMELAEPYLNKVPMIIHGFHKSAELGAQLVAKGFYLSLNPALLKREAFDFTMIPEEYLFLETDMAEDLQIEEVYDMAAVRFNMKVEALKERINLNFERLKQKR